MCKISQIYRRVMKNSHKYKKKHSSPSYQTHKGYDKKCHNYTQLTWPKVKCYFTCIINI